MSRVGKRPVMLPSGVNFKIEGTHVVVDGKLGSLAFSFPREVKIGNDGNVLKVEPIENSKRARAMWGLSRNLLNNMVVGVSEGFTKRLEIIGVGYKANVDGKYLSLALGFSHEVKVEIPAGVKIVAEKPTTLVITGCDKQKVGELAATIIKLRPPEPYKGKGIREEGQYVRRKEGKKK
jgi:large subunit ribosomal protein L6